jgi:small subunit ribosomal protein S9
LTEKAEKTYGTGKRKTAVARVWLSPGTGNILVNGLPMPQFLPVLSLQERVREPLETVQLVGRVDIVAKTRGGGIRGQADAIRHGIAKALVEYDQGLHGALRQAGFLTRDPRVKERKKYGRKRARRGFQFSKR